MSSNHDLLERLIDIMEDNPTLEARSLGACTDSTPRDRRNQRRLALACLGWALCFLAVTVLIREELLPDGAAPWVVAALPTLVGVFVLVAFSRFLRQTDELQRLIQLQALAIAFGGGWLVSTGYRLYERLGAPSLDIVDNISAMAVLYAIAVVVAQRRYR